MQDLNEKIVLRVGRLQFTTLALSEAVAALVLGVLSLLFLVSGYRDCQVTWQFSEALQGYFSDQAAEAGLALARARNARPEYAPIQEIYAKTLIDRATPYTKDLASLDEAIAVLSRAGGSSPPWTILVAGAVARIKKYDLAQEKSHLDEAEKMLEAARSAASEIPEPVIELGQIALRRGDRAGAERLFKEALEEPHGIPTIDGLLDLYLGRAAVFVLAKRWSDARDELLRAHFLNPRAKLPGISYAYLCARIASEPRELSDEDLVAQEADCTARIARVNVGFKWPTELRAELERASCAARIGLAAHWARKGSPAAANTMLTDTTAPFDRLFLLNNACFGLIRAANKGVGPGIAQGAHLGVLLDSWLSEAQRLKLPDKLRVTALNNLAFANCYSQNLEAAENYAQEALKQQQRLAEPPDYVLYRNLGIILHSRKNFVDAVKAYEKSRELNPNQSDVKAALDRLKS